jgi:acyl-CoA synthetase (AMP-forming)/AMP-acid ligase II
MRTIAEMLRWRARRHPSLDAVWFDGKSTTFAAFNESTSQLAAGLLDKLGLQPGDRVGILDKNCAAYFELFFALDKAGLVAAPLNWRLTPHEIKQIVDDVKPKLMVTGAEFKATAAATGVATMTFADLPRGGDDPRRDVDGAVCAQFCTSGTTGLPKGAMLTGWNLLNVGSAGALESPEMRQGGRSLVCLPLFHIGGTIWAMWAMQTGSTVCIVREPLPDVLLKTMVEQRIESALLVPTLMLLMTELPASRTADFSALKLITYGTAPISPDLLRRSIETFKCRFMQLYGLTETTGPFTTLPHEQHVGERLLSCGRPMLGGRVRIVDSDGKDLPPYEIGEILYQGENLMAGYWAREDATAQAIRKGWFHTGDAGYVDDEGFIFLKDRIKDMIISGGENVYPAEIEGVLMGHPEVLECAVIGVPDAKWGETVKAVVVRRQGASLSEAALIAWSRDQLAGFKRPSSVDFIDALPRNAAGKLLKRTLREPYWAGHTRRIN